MLALSRRLAAFLLLAVTTLGALAPGARAEGLRPLSELLARRPSPSPPSLPPLPRPPTADATRVYSMLDTVHCPESVRAGLPILTQSVPGFPLHLNLLRTMQAVERAYQTLRDTHDLVLTGSPTLGGENQVCVGIYQDGTKPNAAALGKGTLVFGATLFQMLSLVQAQNEMISVVVLHEFAHNLQNLHRIDYSVGLGDKKLELVSTKRKELTADCVAGALFAQQNPRLLSMAENQSLGALFGYLGDQHVLGDHGLACQRGKAFSYGFEYRHQVPAGETFELRSGPLLQTCLAAIDRPEVFWAECPER